MIITDTAFAPAPAEFPLPADALPRLRERLAVDADAAGLLDVAYRTIETPIGPLLLAATPRGLARIAFEREGFDHVLDLLAERISPRIVLAPQRLSEPVRQLGEYFAGRRRGFDLPLDDRLSAGFRRDVQRRLPSIGYGSTMTYREVAELVGHPAAARAVGTACATNPLPVVVPCHRVLRSDGTIGGYAGGPDVKSALLALERAA